MTPDNGHTAGPWKAAAKPSSIVGWPVVAPHAGGRMICDVALAPKPADMSDGEWSRHYVEVEANARLIAAAPALLEALEKSAEGWSNAIELGLIPTQHITAATILRDEARSALLQARGEAG